MTLLIVLTVFRLNGINHWTNIAILGIAAAWLGVKVPWLDIVNRITRGGQDDGSSDKDNS